MTARRRHGRLVAIALFLMLAAIAASTILDRLIPDQPFDIPSASEARRAQARFSAALAGETRDLPAGLAMYRVEGRDERVLREAAGDCRGRGVYRLRDGQGAAPLALVAPHDGADRHTGEIVRLMFEDGNAAAAAWNSAPRRPGPDCPGGGDPTRHKTHFLTAFSLAFAERHPSGRIVQVHGFDAGNRTSRAAQLADVIVSDGSRTPAPALLDLADCLSARLAPMRVLVFPLETGELGATVNRQGQALRAAGFTGFAHVELSSRLRQRLVTDTPLRAAFLRCFESGPR